MNRYPWLRTARRCLWLLALLAGVSCGSANATPTPMPSSTPAPPTPTATATERPTATPTLPPTETPTPAPLEPSAILEHTAPSVAYVETTSGFGSGVFVEGGYLVTNAHVVWPYGEARVVFADGSEFPDTPVVNWDLMADLAVLGPLADAEAPPLPLVDGESLVTGSDVYLIGYPSEVDTFPEPTITRGLISRVREWETMGITYFQTDATIAGGQSGGALVSQLGEVIGISGYAFGPGEFGIAASSADVMPRVAQLIAGEDPARLGDRLPGTDPSRQHQFSLRHDFDSATFFLYGQRDDEIVVDVDGLNDVFVLIRDEFGFELLAVDDNFSGAEHISYEIDTDGLYYVEVYQYDVKPGFVSLTGQTGLIPIVDPDDNDTLSVDEAAVGAIGHPGDIDFFRLSLEAGEIVSFYLDSMTINPYLSITYLGADDEQIVADDDSGGGPFGLNAQLTYRAPHSGDYLVVVSDASRQYSGGYSLSVESRREGAPTPISPPPTATPISGPHGPMQWYETDNGNFAIQVPDWWDALDDLTLCAPNATACYVGDEGGVSFFNERTGNETFTTNSFVDLLIANLRATFPSLTVVSRSSRTAPSGDTVVEAELIITAGEARQHMMLLTTATADYVFVIFYETVGTFSPEMKALISYSFSTFEIR